MTPNEFERRASSLLGGHGWQNRWGTAIGISRQHVSKVVNGKATLPPTWPVIVELLENVDSNRWPMRWSLKNDATC